MNNGSLCSEPFYVPTLLFFVVKFYWTRIPNLKVCDLSYTYRTRDTSCYSSWTPSNLAFLELNNTAVIILKVSCKIYESIYRTDGIAMCLRVASSSVLYTLLCYGLPGMFPIRALYLLILMFIHHSYILLSLISLAILQNPSRKTCFCYRPMCIPHCLLNGSLSSPMFYSIFTRTSLWAVSLFPALPSQPSFHESYTIHRIEVPKNLILTLHQKRYRITPETVWRTTHGIVGLGIAIWWQGMVHLAQMARAARG